LHFLCTPSGCPPCRSHALGHARSDTGHAQDARAY
jgi:hypothetical protein